MSTDNNLFNFSRKLPAPFDSSSARVSVTSKYGEGTNATLCAAVIKAVNAVCACKYGTGEGAVGKIDHRSIAEYKSSVSPNAYHLVIYDSVSGNISASVYDTSTELIESYALGPKGRDGAAVFMAMMPTLMKDEEFAENFERYSKQYLSSFSDITEATNRMAILCDNAYRRIKNETCPAHIAATIEASGNLTRVTQAQLDSGKLVPTEVLAGEFNIFAKTEKARSIKKAETIIEQSDFVGKFPLHPRMFTALEQSLIPKLPEWYIIPQEVVDICKHAAVTTGKPTQMRNFLLRGPAGTGKTMGAKAIAAGLGLPYMKYTCSAGTEIFDCATCS